MKTVTLTPTKKPELVLEADTITPDSFAGKTAEQIAKLPVYQGKQDCTLGEFFTVAGLPGATPS